MFKLPRDLENAEDLPKAFQEQWKPTSERGSFTHVTATAVLGLGQLLGAGGVMAVTGGREGAAGTQHRDLLGVELGESTVEASL